ncbi:MAG: hypothetical protein ACFFCZ_14535 [Promethearchaeota archaeon]
MEKGKKFYLHEFSVPCYWVTSRSIYSKPKVYRIEGDGAQSAKKMRLPFYNLLLKVKKILKTK